MKSMLINFIVIFSIFSVSAQNDPGRILEQVEDNNSTLKAYRSETDAALIGNKTGLMPPNPEIEFNYLWGDPAGIGTRTDISVVQSFDFPTVYSYRAQLAAMRNEQAELLYQRYRNEMFHQVRMILAELTYINALVVEYSERAEHVQQLADSYKRMLEVGETSILEANKAGVNLLGIIGELEQLKLEQQMLLAELERLNGGNPVNFTNTSFELMPPELDFESWYALAEKENPLLGWLKQQVELSLKQVQLQKALRMPKFHAGYMSEKVVGEQFQGITAGISIPLWENKQRVNESRALAGVAVDKEIDARFQFYSEMKKHYQKTIALQAQAIAFETQLKTYSNRELLEKALDAGELSLTEYLIEVSAYYEAIDRMLELKYETLKARYLLRRYEL
ncbi:MAG TPA: TolC family protein [Mariniphaga sp.]|nr:TolC family protein [Mariniphaga sp.]